MPAEARIRAVIGARRAFAERETGAAWALRQSLVDLASVCAVLAGELPVPRIPVHPGGQEVRTDRGPGSYARATGLERQRLAAQTADLRHQGPAVTASR